MSQYTTRERALEAALRQMLRADEAQMNGETFPFSDAILQARAALALPPSPQPPPVAEDSWRMDNSEGDSIAIYGGGVQIASVHSFVKDARLIAAAPDMLAALRECLNPLIRLGDFIGNEHKGENGIPAFDRCAIIRQVRAAIARATGQEG